MMTSLVKHLPHPNVMLALRDFGAHLIELPSASAERRAEIYHEAAICDDLMTYSYEIADTSHRAWKLLERRVTQVLIESHPS